MNELEKKLAELSLDLKGMIEQAKAQEKNAGAMSAELKNAIDSVQRRMDDIEVKLLAPSQKEQDRTFEQELKENESFSRLQRDGRGSAVISFKGGIREIQRKTTITTGAIGGNAQQSSVLQYDRDPGIEQYAHRRMFVRDLLPQRPTSFNAIDFVKVNSFTNAASPQVEASAKAESALDFATATANVRTIAHWIPATKQILDDFPGLAELINSELIYGLKLIEERQLLSGSNTGQDLNGLITQATSFSTGLLGSAAWHKADVLARAMQQIEVADQVPVEWFVLNPKDFWDIVLTKDADRNYVAGNAYSILAPTLWGRRVVVTNGITSGTFLAGNSMKATIRDREAVNIEISTEHANFFTENKVAIRCEERLALVVRRPASYITGSFSTSPA